MASVLTRLLARLKTGNSLTHRSGRATGWVVLGFGANNGLRLLSNLALTRILSPEVFGLMALATVILGGVKMFSEIGTGKSVVRSPRGDELVYLQTAWTVQVIRGFVITAVTCLLAWPAAQIYDQPTLFPLMCAMAVTALLSGFFTISAATANRKLMMKRLTAMSIVTRAVTAVVTVAAAWMLESVWALVIGAIFGVVFNLAAGYIVLPPFQHRLKLERDALSELIRYGRWILLATLFTFLAGNGQQAIYGLLVPVETLGLIAIAALIAAIPSQFGTKILSSVVFPSFAEIWRDRPQDLPRVMRKVRLTMIVVLFPVFFLSSYFAQPVIDLLYDDRYQLAGVFLALVPLNRALNLMAVPYQQLLLAEGRSDIHAFMTFLSGALTILGIVGGFALFGIIGSFVCIGVGFAIKFGVILGIAWRRGYASVGIDLMTLLGIGLFYVFILTTLEAPAEMWLPQGLS